MKFLIVFVALFAVALAAPAATGPEVSIVRSDSEVGPESYKYSWETSDGSNAQEDGHLTNPGAENEAIAVRGSFSFVGDDGVTYTVNYIADENGFQPSGAHLPVAPSA